jgi:hypothetical protein
MSTRDRVTDEQWELIERILPSPSVRSDGRGRPWKNNREVLNGIIWILCSGARYTLSFTRVCSLKSKDSSCPNRFYALKTLSTSPVEEYDYVQIATSTCSCTLTYIATFARLGIYETTSNLRFPGLTARILLPIGSWLVSARSFPRVIEPSRRVVSFADSVVKRR